MGVVVGAVLSDGLGAVATAGAAEAGAAVVGASASTGATLANAGFVKVAPARALARASSIAFCIRASYWAPAVVGGGELADGGVGAVSDASYWAGRASGDDRCGRVATAVPVAICGGSGGCGDNVVGDAGCGSGGGGGEEDEEEDEEEEMAEGTVGVPPAPSSAPKSGAPSSAPKSGTRRSSVALHVNGVSLSRKIHVVETCSQHSVSSHAPSSSRRTSAVSVSSMASVKALSPLEFTS